MKHGIVQTLELMCDKDNAQDRKILLLAELVDTKCEVLGKNQEALQKSLDDTNEKLDKLTELLERYEQDTHGCPVYRNRVEYEKFSVFIKYPKIAMFVLLGILALLGGFFGSSFVSVIKSVFGI